MVLQPLFAVTVNTTAPRQSPVTVGKILPELHEYENGDPLPEATAVIDPVHALKQLIFVWVNVRLGELKLLIVIICVLAHPAPFWSLTVSV
jgi:hypothetical protein